ncbi:MAG: pyrroline-5-carboxylate reductase [Deltaproteobacteria bacterium]|nr:pyrroline-5-carboxylate reductase [Deltaproteobacteria bacterium]
MEERKREHWTAGRLGFIGAGSMGGALIRGLLASGRVVREDLLYCDPDHLRQGEMADLWVKRARHNVDVMTADTVVLAVKPQVAAGVLQEIKGQDRPGQRVISIIAGLPLAVLEEALPQARVLRAMPNTPVLVRAGITAVAAGSRASAEDLLYALELFRAGGRAVTVSEGHLDAVTGLSGSGPAYVALFIEALADGGVKMGLPRALALELAAQTVLGTACLCLEKGLHPAALKDQVASPGGTTIHGLHALEQGGFRAAVMSAVESATWRAQDLAAAGVK